MLVHHSIYMHHFGAGVSSILMMLLLNDGCLGQLPVAQSPSQPSHVAVATLSMPTPPQPPFAPLPPVFPPPPSPPPGVCVDTCNSPGPGAKGPCDDGGPGSVSSLCEFGTDCDDCGVRIFCTSCPERCQALALTDPENACMESMWNDGTCDAECNNAECDHSAPQPLAIRGWPAVSRLKGQYTPRPLRPAFLTRRLSRACDASVDDCTTSQIIEKCVPEQEVRRGRSPLPPL